MHRRRRSGPSAPWWEVQYPGATLAIRFTTAANAGETVTPAVVKTGVPVMWDFGDGTTQTVNSASHTYATAGPHDLTLVIYDDVLTITQLNMNGDKLTGSIPPELGLLSSLIVLNLSSNQLTGSIPVELGALSSLLYLYLNNNQLSGSIPPELGALSSLIVLNLSSNQLTGSIPVELGALSSLLYLYLNSNQLSGSIPPELGALSSLLYLYLNSNQLSGSIPPELGALSSLIVLNLSSNQLTGSIPPELGALSSLTALFLYSNLYLTADMDVFVDTIWQSRNGFTGSPYIHIGGTNQNPSGIYQNACPPVTPLEKVFNLANKNCAGDIFNAQTWVY